MTSAIQPYQGNQIIRTMDDAERAATAMAKSGFFADSRDASQAVVKILAGQELGFGPFAAMNGVYIIQGRPSIGANLMAAAVKKSGRYNYRVTEMTEKICSIDYYENGQVIGNSTFTIEDARKAGTKNLDKYPRNMLFARAMSNGCRWFVPDVFNGNTVYTPEELGANVNEDGEIIDVPHTPAPAAPQNGKQEQPAAPTMTIEYAMEFQTKDGRKLKDLSREELEANEASARKVDPERRTAGWHKAYTALEMVMEYREREDEAARAAENE